MQVQGKPDFGLLLRTRATTVIGQVQKATHGRQVNSDYIFRTQFKVDIETSPWSDATFAQNQDLYTINTHGLVQLWDAGREKKFVFYLPRTRKLDVGALDEHDAFWALAPSKHVLDVASCYTLYTLDIRVRVMLTQAPRPVNVMSTAHSNHVLRRTKLTSLKTSNLIVQDRPLLALSTTDEVQYYDRRYTRVPLYSWAHRRGYDRSLSLCPVPTSGSDCFLLSSQHNRLLVAYGAEIDSLQEVNSLKLHTPSFIESAVPPQLERQSPTHPFIADLSALGWDEDLVYTVEQSMLGALWMRPFSRKKDYEWPNLYINWSQEARECERKASEMDDPGPFGDAEMTPVDYRTLYKGL